MTQNVEIVSYDKTDDSYADFSLQGKNLSELGGLKLTSTLAETSKGVELDICVTSMFRLGTEVDLKHLQKSIRCSKSSSSGKMLTGRLRDPAITFSVFSTGACICSFAKSQEESLLGARKVANLVRKLGYNVKFSNYQILNVSYRFSLGKEVDLENARKVFDRFESKYEPEVSEELIINIDNTSSNFFKNGTVIISGAKSIAHAEFVYNIILYTINTDFSQSVCKDGSEDSTGSEEFFENEVRSEKNFSEYI